ncbi:MAG: hypothetical protein B7X90_09200 [Novosphingobium sp. 17-62-19]|uniref:hypothetical protein n=1 Tax=Novosphingobium sp. 17-62-19 TaxID=1970406 RepID=UPI000BC66210|nr:hypothetical protein [Novosphingobium sp. 17-62-19]OYX95797.1 MAG: hypothetical protein B7Y74_03260 [Novosphingobium sp. 35-62-5]OZA19300.1 MAG: hypothetical protein B7X90_09200 [Novosphingobium sp. 17-62-19]HQS95369.1 hypothetical protein [Novosphingobium sp.]
MKIARIASALAATALMAAPVVAEAGTRASSSSVYPAASYTASRATTSVDADNNLLPFLWIFVVIAVGAAAYGVSQAVDNGTNGAG